LPKLRIKENANGLRRKGKEKLSPTMKRRKKLIAENSFDDLMKVYTAPVGLIDVQARLTIKKPFSTVITRSFFARQFFMSRKRET
jgi:hypothetical protein